MTVAEKVGDREEGGRGTVTVAVRSLNWAGLEIHAGLPVVLCKLGLQV